MIKKLRENFLKSPKSTAKGLSIAIGTILSVIGMIVSVKYPVVGDIIKENATEISLSVGSIIAIVIAIFGAKEDTK